MADKLLIIGLGNPGKRYDNTPHNIGFEIIDELAKKWAVEMQPSRQVQAMIGSTLQNGCAIHLMKPTTYMNLSGAAAAPYMKRQNIFEDQIIVVYDEIDLPLGRIRLRERGSHGGHKGMLSMMNTLGTREIQRLRVGIRSNGPIYDTANYVLSKLPPDQRIQLDAGREQAIKGLETIIKEDFITAMNQFNTLPKTEKKD